MLKNKQISSINHLHGEALIADGSGKTVFAYPQMQKGITFPVNPTSGDTFYHITDNEIYCYDYVRLKWITIYKEIIELGRNTLATNTAGYLGIADFYHTSTTGFKLMKNGTILSASVINDNVVTRTIQIRINNSSTTYVDLSLSGQSSKIVTNANLDFNSGDFLNVYIDTGTSAAMSKISVLIEIAWRH